MKQDPLGLIPRALPPHPRLLLDRSGVARAREFARELSWAQAGFRYLIAAARRALELDAKLSAEPDAQRNHALKTGGLDLALAYQLTGDERYAAKARAILLSLAAAYPTWPQRPGGERGAGYLLAEKGWVEQLAWCYDLVHDYLSEEDRQRIAAGLLRPGVETVRFPVHKTCGNHRTWGLAAIWAVGLALDEKDYLREVIYGRTDRETGDKFYGLAHQMGHDILADGLHWERTLGYHFYTLMALADIADMAAHSGVDLWHAEFDALSRRSSALDLHRDYGPRGKRSLRFMFDAPFYYAFSDGSCADVGDSGVGNLAQAGIWGPIYEMAYAAYADAKYAWLSNRIYARLRRDEPSWKPARSWGGWRFVRVTTPELPKGEFSLAKDASFGNVGRHERGCSLFPVAGYAVLRRNPNRKDLAEVLLTWSPQSAGHQHADRLSICLRMGGELILAESGGLGYDNPQHLTWARQTIAHNTVTVDETSMHPQRDHEEPDAIWQCDYGQPPSDGRLTLFHVDPLLKAVRAECENAYRGVMLERTIALVPNAVLDVYQATSRAAHIYDFALHVPGEIALLSPSVEGPRPEDPKPALAPDSTSLGTRLGYRHLESVKTTEVGDLGLAGWFRVRGASVLARFAVNRKARAFLAAEPAAGGVSRNCLMLRTRAKTATFAAVYAPEGAEIVPLTLLYGVVFCCVGFGRNRDYLMVGPARKLRRYAPTSPPGRTVVVLNHDHRGGGHIRVAVGKK